MTVESSALPDALDPLGVLVIRLAPDGTVLSCNESVAELLGLEADSVVGRHHQSLFGSLDVPRACVVDRTLFHRDGASCRVRWSISPEFDPSGKPSGMSCLGMQVSDLVHSDGRVEAPPPLPPDGVFLIDGDGRIERMNRAAAKLFNLDEVILGSGKRDQTESFTKAAITGVGAQATEAGATLRIEGETIHGSPQEPSPSAGAGRSPVADGFSETKHLNALKEVLRATRMSSPVDLTRSLLPRIAELVSAQAAAVAFEAEGRQFVEFFGLPPETAAMVVDLLSRSEFNLVPLRALTRMHVLACVPLVGSNGRFGHMLLFSRHQAHLDEGRQETLETLSKSFSVALENVLVTRQIESVRASRDSAHESILRAMVAALELRDQETEGHTQRVTRISMQLGELLGLQGDELRNLEHGALLHDIGKIGIPDSILHKPGPLSASEWEIMRRHPQYAYDILSPLPHLSHALDVPYCHHERFDGSGYPRGLEGVDIPLSARIFAVVDVYDAMTTERPYRPALPEDYAIAHLRSHSGTHFDPQVVDAFTALIEKLGLAEPVQGS